MEPKTKQQRLHQKQGKEMQILSRKLSKVLRHSAISLGLPIAPNGYVPVPVLLNHSMFRNCTVDQVMEVVETSDKQRFKLQRIDGVLCIRANQGHSIDAVKAELLLQELTGEELAALPTIVHGTYYEPWTKISSEGLKRMKRNHIHFATAIPADGSVISGMRKSSQVYIFIDGCKCAEDGIVFYKSDNGVILTSGIDGVLPVKYFEKVTDNRGRNVLASAGATNQKD